MQRCEGVAPRHLNLGGQGSWLRVSLFGLCVYQCWGVGTHGSTNARVQYQEMLGSVVVAVPSRCGRQSKVPSLRILPLVQIAVSCD